MKKHQRTFQSKFKYCKHFFIRVRKFICWPVVVILLFKFYFHSVQRRSPRFLIRWTDIPIWSRAHQRLCYKKKEIDWYRPTTDSKIFF
jgi:hypothetical protein